MKPQSCVGEMVWGFEYVWVVLMCIGIDICAISPCLFSIRLDIARETCHLLSIHLRLEQHVLMMVSLKSVLETLERELLKSIM